MGLYTKDLLCELAIPFKPDDRILVLNGGVYYELQLISLRIHALYKDDGTKDYVYAYQDSLGRKWKMKALINGYQKHLEVIANTFVIPEIDD